jgi:threonine/homoserine/homoserine lactone efflux protein
MMYFLSLFTGFVPLTAAPYEKLLIGVLLVGITFSWYTLVALTFSRQRIRRLYQRSTRGMNAAFGLLWLFMALKLAGV